jgi:hypothetical protein
VIEILEREFKKNFPSQESPISEFIPKLNYLKILKKSFDIYFICALEISHRLTLMGLKSISMTILKLFQIFKIQMTFFLKYNIHFFKMQHLFSQNEEEEPVKKEG